MIKLEPGLPPACVLYPVDIYRETGRDDLDRMENSQPGGPPMDA